MAHKLDWGVRGVMLPMITPFTTELEIDWAGLDTLVDWAIEDVGVDALVPVGTTGESPTLSHSEHIEVFTRVIQRTAGRVPVVPGAGSNSTKEAIELTQAAKDAGAAATLQVCPYYNKPSQQGLYDHFAAIARSVDLPMILYNIPGRTGRNIEAATIVRLWEEVPQVVGVKEASGDVQQAMHILAGTERETFQVYSGEDIMTFSLLSLGGSGAIAAVAHVIGREIKQMCHMIWDGDLEGARAIHFRTMDLVEALFAEPNPIPVKKAVEWLGLPAGPLRPPLADMTNAGQERLREIMTAGGWLRQ